MSKNKTKICFTVKDTKTGKIYSQDQVYRLHFNKGECFAAVIDNPNGEEEIVLLYDLELKINVTLRKKRRRSNEIKQSTKTSFKKIK